MAVPFLDKIPAFASAHPNATFRVQWAPNSYLPDPSGWAWVDISNDVMQADGRAVEIGPMGKSDATQQTQPAGCTFYLDNRSGDYSKGPQSAYYPNLTLNIPIRVQVALNGVAYTTRFQGYTYSLRPEWDQTGNYAVTRVQAAGVSRRLQLGAPELKSPLYRAFTRADNVVGYWPMEDEAGSTVLRSGLSNGKDLRFNGLTLADYSGIIGSAPLPVFTSSGRMSGPVTHTFAGNWEVDFLLYVDAIPAGDTAVLRIHTKGSEVVRWEIVLVGGSSTTMRIDGYLNNATTTVTDSGAMGTTVGIPLSCRFMAKQNGTTTDYQLVVFPATLGTGAVNSGSVASTTVGNVSEISNLAAAGMVDTTLGHIVVLDDYDSAFPDEALVAYGLASAYYETARRRANGLADEEQVEWVQESTTSVEYMGPQGRKSLMDLLRECEQVDGGILWDGYGPGLNWKSLQDIVSQGAALTLATTDLVPPFGPEDDDQGVVNRMTVTKLDGAASTYEDSTGPMGTGAIGFYESSVSGLNNLYEERARDYAAWYVHLGTVEGYRFPQISIDLRRIPSKASAWMATDPGSRITISSINDWVSQLPNGDIDVVMFGYTETLSRFEWSVTMNCAPWTPYEVALMDDASDTYDTRAGWLDTDGSSVNGVHSAGATSLSVATTSGQPLWTTSSNYLPVYISVGGYRVQLTAVSGSSSPQTFTVSALPAALAGGEDVTLWYPDYYGL